MARHAPLEAASFSDVVRMPTAVWLFVGKDVNASDIIPCCALMGIGCKV